MFPLNFRPFPLGECGERRAGLRGREGGRGTERKGLDCWKSLSHLGQGGAGTASFPISGISESPSSREKVGVKPGSSLPPSSAVGRSALTRGQARADSCGPSAPAARLRGLIPSHPRHRAQQEGRLATVGSALRGLGSLS